VKNDTEMTYLVSGGTWNLNSINPPLHCFRGTDGWRGGVSSARGWGAAAHRPTPLSKLFTSMSRYHHAVHV